MSPEDHGSDLPRFADWRPTAFDARGLGSEGQEDWRVLPVIQTRDSGPLETSNFAAARAILDEAGADYIVHSFGHWGPGWFEIIVVEPTPIGLAAAGDIACRLADYPILDEDDFSARECEDADESWSSWGHRAFVDACRPYVSDLAADALEDAPDACWEALHSWSYNPVEHHSDGPCFDVECVDSPRVTRNDLARLLVAAKKERNA